MVEMSGPLVREGIWGKAERAWPFGLTLLTFLEQLPHSGP